LTLDFGRWTLDFITPVGNLQVRCYDVCVAMKRYRLTTYPHIETVLEKVLASFLLVGLLFSASASGNARNRAKEEEGSSSVRSAGSGFRDYALTSVPNQRTASHLSKKNSAKHPVNHGGLSPIESAAPAATGHEIFVATDRSVLYLSFRVSPPGGRAPPASA
jgi:hypothetical protein